MISFNPQVLIPHFTPSISYHTGMTAGSSLCTPNPNRVWLGIFANPMFDVKIIPQIGTTQGYGIVFNPSNTQFIIDFQHAGSLTTLEWIVSASLGLADFVVIENVYTVKR